MICRYLYLGYLLVQSFSKKAVAGEKADFSFRIRKKVRSFALEFYTKNRLFLRPELSLKSKTYTNLQRIGCLVYHEITQISERSLNRSSIERFMYKLYFRRSLEHLLHFIFSQMEVKIIFQNGIIEEVDRIS